MESCDLKLSWLSFLLALGLFKLWEHCNGTGHSVFVINLTQQIENNNRTSKRWLMQDLRNNYTSKKGPISSWRCTVQQRGSGVYITVLQRLKSDDLDLTGKSVCSSGLECRMLYWDSACNTFNLKTASWLHKRAPVIASYKIMRMLTLTTQWPKEETGPGCKNGTPVCQSWPGGKLETLVLKYISSGQPVSYT